MTYATLDQLTARLGLPLLISLTDRGDVATGVVDETVTDRALREATDMVDGYVATKYVLPLAEVPGILTDLTLSIAAWKLYINDAPDKVKDDYDRALRSLKDIADGRIRLIGAAGLQAPTSGANGVVVTDRPRDFTADSMKGFI